MMLLANVDNFARVIVGLFAIAGGFLIGNILMLLFLRITCRLLFGQQAPYWVRSILRMAAGLTVAIFVGMYVFGEGGMGWGPGTGTNPGDVGPGENPKVEREKEIPKIEPKKEEPPKTKEEEAALEERAKIVVLGGDATEERFYLYEEENQPLSLAEITERLRIRKEKSTKPLKGLAIFVYKNSAALGNPVVMDLQHWAKQHNLGVYFPPVQNEFRPER